MRKVWNTLVVLGILLCMIMSLGVTADAAEGDAAIFAVSGTQLAPENLDVIRTEYPGCLVVDVNGPDEGQSLTGYSAVYVDSEPMDPVDYTPIWPGYALDFTLGNPERKVVLVGVDGVVGAEAVTAAVSAYLEADPYVIAVGPNAAAATVAACVDVDMFLTVDLKDPAGAAVVVSVGEQAEYPVSLVKVNDGSSASAEAIAVPQPAAAPIPEADPYQQPDQTGSDGSEDDLGEPVPEDEPQIQTTCTITYDGNGRTGGMVNDVYDFVAGQTHILAENGYTRDGYEFAGWTVGDDGTVYQPGDGVVVDHDVTVYAQWNEIAVNEPSAPQEEPGDGDGMLSPAASEQYNVTYNCGEGSGADVTYTLDANTQITLPESGFTAPEGMKFAGWKVSGTEDIWAPNVTYTLQSDVTFVAQYKPFYIISYEFGDSGNDNYTVEVLEGEIHGLDAGPAVIPEGKVFVGWLVNGEPKNAGEEITITGNVVVTPQWGESEPETAVVDGQITVTYKSGIEGMDDYTVKVDANANFPLAECPFTLPEDLAFVGWKQAVSTDGVETIDPQSETLPAGATFASAESNLTFIAETAAKVQATVTYVPGDGSDTKFEDKTAGFKSGDTVQYQLLDLAAAGFASPDGKTFGGWKIGDASYQPGEEVTLNGDTTVTAVWNDVVKDKVKATVEGDTDSLMFTQGFSSTDTLQVTYRAQIDTVSVDNTALELNKQYGTVAGDEAGTYKLFFQSSYLNSLSVGAHTLNVTFVATDTTEYEPDTRTLEIKAEPAKETNSVNGISETWDRSQNLIIDFAKYDRGNPIKLELLRAYEKDASGNYKKDENGNYIPVWSELTKDKDYSINGTAMTFYPSLLGTWGNQQYGFRVTFDGTGTDLGTNTMILSLAVTGEAPKAEATATATPAVSPSATPNGPTSPATGDHNNVTLYIVILAVLIVALAAVLIIVAKRRKN